MIYNRTIKLILERLEYKLAIQSNECKIYHKKLLLIIRRNN